MGKKLEQLECGQCGNRKHLIFQRTNGEIVIECIECNSVSEITLTEPKINIRNLLGLGTLCKVRS